MNREQLFEVIDSMRDEMVDFLKALIAIPSENPPGMYEEIASFIADYYRKLGLETEIVRVPDERVKAENLETPRYNVVATLRGRSGSPRLIMNPHLDTVPAGSGWTYPPFGGTVVEDKIYGRGACDSKGQCVVYAYALSALARCGIKLEGDAVIVATADEESGGVLGAGYMLEQGYSAGDWAISEGNTYEIINALDGCLHLKITVVGKSAHASTPEYGIDAIEKMNRILSKLYAYRDKIVERHSSVAGLDHPTLIVGTIQGGVKTNVVPGECTITVDRRIIPEENAAEVESEIMRVVQSAVDEDPDLHVKVERTMLAESYGPVPTDSLLIKYLRKNAVDVLGLEPEVKGLPGFGDARFYWNMANMPSVMYGAGTADAQEANAHGPDENLNINDLVKAAKVLALTVVDLLSEV